MSEVVWVDTNRMSFDNSITAKIQRLISESRATEDLKQDMRVALKVNTSEEGYEYGLRPVFIRTVADMIQQATKKRPTICDGLKLIDYWRQSKGNNFLDVTRGKGYSNDTLGGNFVINGGFSGDEGNLYACDLPGSQIGGVEVGTAVCRSDALCVLSHVTLHPLFGLSGALLNGGFECLIGRAKTRVLGDADFYPFNGNTSPREKAREFQQRALESHLGVRKAMERRIHYINFLWDITPQPEYFPFSKDPVVRNLGFLSSNDPVAIDAATFELVTDELGMSQPGDAIEGLMRIDFEYVLEEAEKMGLGFRRRYLRQLS